MPEERMGLPPALVCRSSAMNKIHYNRIILIIQYTFIYTTYCKARGYVSKTKLNESQRPNPSFMQTGFWWNLLWSWSFMRFGGQNPSLSIVPFRA